LCSKPCDYLIDSEKYKNDFILSLKNVALFEKIQGFFSYLFFEDSPDRPLSERCYIVITRKGFSLWTAGMLCGMMGQKVLDSDTLISDRQWKLMTIKERTMFISNKHVFVADDSVITGAVSQSVYMDIEVGEGRAKSRSVAFLAADENYNFNSMFQYYFRSDEVDIEKRREYSDRVLYAMYQLAIPYTASSPVYHTRMPLSVFNKLKEESNKDNDFTWIYENTPLDFGGDIIAQNVGVFKAPKDIVFGKNVLLRGMRVCWNNICINGEVGITFIPWIIFDAIDFAKAKTYLKECVIAYIPDYETTSWLFEQLEYGEPGRVQTMVHRVISYLYDWCILNEFKDFLRNSRQQHFQFVLSPFILPNSIMLEQYHFPPKLYNELKIISDSIEKDKNYPTSHLAMDENEYNELSHAIFEMSYSRLEIPEKQTEDIDDLENKLLKQREVTKSKDGSPIFPSITKKHPLICYKGKRSLKTLDLIRRAIGSLRSEILSYKDKFYLINTLLPGEGSHLVFSNHFDFIYAYHQGIEIGKCVPGKEKDFVNAWNLAIKKRDTLVEEKDNFRFSYMDPKTVGAYFGTENEDPVYDLPSTCAILNSKGINLYCVTGNEANYSFFNEINNVVNSM